MHLTRFEIENFRSISRKQNEKVACRNQVIDHANYKTPFRIDAAPGLNLIVGPNGVGKTNILRALRYALDKNSPERLKDNRSRENSKKRTIKVTTNFACLRSELDGCSDETKSLQFFARESDNLTIRRTLKETFTVANRRTQISYAFMHANEIEVDEPSETLLDLEKICTESHLLISLDTLPAWHHESNLLLIEAERSGIPSAELFWEFNSIVTGELDLKLTFPSDSIATYSELSILFENTKDRFGENPLLDQGRGVQATLVYALAASIIRQRAKLCIGSGVTLLLEEPENGLHIDLQRKLTEVLDRSSGLAMDCSIVITTNSPFLVPEGSIHRLFEVVATEDNAATLRKNFHWNTEAPRHWLEPEDPNTEAFFSLLESRSLARVLDLHRKSRRVGKDHLLVVEGFLDKLYIQTAVRLSGIMNFDYRVMSSGESLEIRNDKKYEHAGVWLLALQILLAYGWANQESKIRAIIDADPDGIETEKALNFLVLRIQTKIKKTENFIDIKIFNTNSAEVGWKSFAPQDLKRNSIWIPTEFEDLWPKAYLEKYFSRFSASNMETRKIAIVEERLNSTHWKYLSEEDATMRAPEDLHEKTLSGRAKGHKGDTGELFASFLHEEPPSKEEAKVFMDRLCRILDIEPQYYP
jgi:hypothetical protein